MDHGDSLLIGADHPGLHHLVGHQLLQDEGGHVLVVLGLDVGKVTLYGLEGEAEEVGPDLLELVHADVVVSTVVKILDITGASLLVMSHDLHSVPASLALGSAHGVDEDRAGDAGAVDLVVGVAHALVQSLQGEVCGMTRLLEEHMTWTTKN